MSQVWTEGPTGVGAGELACEGVGVRADADAGAGAEAGEEADAGVMRLM